MNMKVGWGWGRSRYGYRAATGVDVNEHTWRMKNMNVG